MTTASATAELERLLPDYLARQRWFGETGDVELEDVRWVRVDDLEPVFLRGEVTVTGGATYQVLVGLRPLTETEEFLEGKGRGFLGDIEIDGGEPMLAYDAVVDPELAARLLAVVAPGEEPGVVRPVLAEATNTLVVFDERLMLKVFRRLPDGPNPDVEVGIALAEAGFDGVPEQIAHWREDGRDLAVVRRYLPGAVDGWDVARTSVRDMLDLRCPPEQCGGDFAHDAERIGRRIGELHVALAGAFGRAPAEPARWAEALAAGLGAERVAGSGAFDALAAVPVDAAGASIRIHGDLHLGQLLHADTGWYVLDFEGEPLVPVAERTAPSSPLRDVAGMIRSLDYAARVTVREQPGQAESDPELEELVGSWVRHNVAAFVRGYRAVDGIDGLVPADGAWPTVLTAFEVAKAAYEVEYELRHRPDWAGIPEAALARLLGS